MIEKIKMAIDNIRPSLQADGGDIELVEFKEAENLVLVKKITIYLMSMNVLESQFHMII